jgi:hypothetical protein
VHKAGQHSQGKVPEEIGAGQGSNNNKLAQASLIMSSHALQALSCRLVIAPCDDATTVGLLGEQDCRERKGERQKKTLAKQ